MVKRITGGETPSLKEISIETTYACGMKCIMCSSSAAYPTPLPKELSLLQIISLLKEAKKLGAQVVSWSGGDPILRPDFWIMVEVANKLGYKQLLYTTGVKFNGQEFEPLSNVELKKMKKLNVTPIFDLQSCNPKTHDKIFGVKGAWEMELEVITEALKLGLPVETHFVPQRDNINEIERYVRFLDELGVSRVSFLRLVPQGRALENYSQIAITKEQFREMQFTFHSLLKNKDFKVEIRLGHPINFLFLVEYELTGALPDDKGLVNGFPVDPCRGGIDAPLIKPDGTVDVCPAWKDLPEYAAGKIDEQGLTAIWKNSPTYRIFRQFIYGRKYQEMKGACRNCPFFQWCKGKCTAQRLIANKFKYGPLPLTQSILLGKDPMCWAEKLNLI